MSGKIAIIGDLHFGIKKADPSFLEYQKNYFKNEFFPVLEKEGIKTIIQTGDILDSRTHIDFLVARYINDFFDYMMDRGYRFFSVLGNHDIYYRQTTKLSGILELTSQYSNVMIVTQLFTMKVPDTNVEIDMVPWICNENSEEVTKRMEDSLNSSDKYKLCIGHFELKDFEMQKGVTCSKSTFDTDILKRYDKVVSGHFHTASIRDNITYIGTPYQLTWNDVNDAKKFIIFDPDKIEYEEVPTKTKKYFIFDFNAVKEKSFDFDQCRQGYIKIVLNDKKASNSVIDKTLAMLESKSEPKQMQVLDKREIEETQAIQAVDLEAVNTPYTAIQNTIKNSLISERIKQLSSDYVTKFCKELDG